jgi:hypothetical protein
MSKNESALMPRLGVEDYLRALGYVAIAAWTVVYLFFPPPPVTTLLEETSRIIWMAVTFFGALGAAAGVLSRIDIKLEFPSLIVVLLGPLFYGFTQVWLITHPDLLGDTTVQARYAIAVYGFIPGVLLLPRMAGLWRDRRRMRRLREALNSQLASMTDEEIAQPGAGLSFKSSMQTTEGTRGRDHK